MGNKHPGFYLDKYDTYAHTVPALSFFFLNPMSMMMYIHTLIPAFFLLCLINMMISTAMMPIAKIHIVPTVIPAIQPPPQPNSICEN